MSVGSVAPETVSLHPAVWFDVQELPIPMRPPVPIDDLFAALARSKFRSRFRLNRKDAAYLADKGLEAVLSHAEDFILERLAPAEPANDGRQTPMRGHPAFVAQHATAACCRSCLAKWHGIPRGQSLSPLELRHILAVLRRWLEAQPSSAPPAEGVVPPRRLGQAEGSDGAPAVQTRLFPDE